MSDRRQSSADEGLAKKAELKASKKAAEAAIVDLKIELNKLITSNQAPSKCVADTAAGVNAAKMKKRRTFANGHFGKVVSVTWHSDSSRAMTSSQDGTVIIWDAIKQCKKHMVPLKSAWVMFAEVSKDGGPEHFMSGGLDNVMTLWKCPDSNSPHSCVREFHGHDGYVSSGRFLTSDTLLTISGDATIGTWKVKSGTKKQTDDDQREGVFKGHKKDVTSIDLKPGSNKEFLTSSADGSVMFWSEGKYTPNSVLRIKDSFDTDTNKDINKAKFMSNGTGVGMATESCGAFLYDVRYNGPVNKFDSSTSAKASTSKYSCCFSKSNRLLFTGGEDFTVEVWDTLTPDAAKPVKSFTEFNNRVTDIATNSMGTAVAAVSWDMTGAVFSA